MKQIYNSKKYTQYKENNWTYLVEYTEITINFYIQKDGYGDYMYMFGLPIEESIDIEDMININKGLYQSYYNEQQCKGEE